MRILKSLISIISSQPGLYGGIRATLNGKVFDRIILQCLGDTTNKRVLDVCCGLGSHSLIITGEYTGIDFNDKEIKYAQKKYSAPQHKFVHGNFLDINLEPKRFDYSLLINALHHFSDEEAQLVLKKISNSTRENIVIVDPNGGTTNPVHRFMLSLDNGNFMRSTSQHKKLLESFFVISNIFEFGVPSRLSTYFCYLCTPRN